MLCSDDFYSLFSTLIFFIKEKSMIYRAHMFKDIYIYREREREREKTVLKARKKVINGADICMEF